MVLILNCASALSNYYDNLNKVAEKEKSPPKEEIDGTTKENKKTVSNVIEYYLYYFNNIC